MDVNYINPFLHGTLDVLKKMAFITAIPGKPFVKKSAAAAGDVSGIIGITGDATGSLALSFTEPCICEIVNSMLGESHAAINAEIIDAVGELTNMISGSARNLMEKEGIKAFAAIPTVVHGKNHTINAIYNVPSIIIPFSTATGLFFVDVCIKTTSPEDRKTATYQVINTKTSVAPTSEKTVTEINKQNDEAAMADRGVILREALKESLLLRSNIEKQLSNDPFLELSKRKMLKNKMTEYETKIRRLKLDISTWEMLSKMDSSEFDKPKTTANFQNYPIKQK
ncbi:MAG: chemotaxis protein CheX [Syntrophales bacterium]